MATLEGVAVELAAETGAAAGVDGRSIIGRVGGVWQQRCIGFVVGVQRAENGIWGFGCGEARGFVRMSEWRERGRQ